MLVFYVMLGAMCEYTSSNVSFFCDNCFSSSEQRSTAALDFDCSADSLAVNSSCAACNSSVFALFACKTVNTSAWS